MAKLINESEEWVNQYWFSTLHVVIYNQYEITPTKNNELTKNINQINRWQLCPCKVKPNKPIVKGIIFILTLKNYSV